MGKIKFNTAHSGVELHRLLHSKLKPSLPARKSSITLILQESKRRSIKLLGNMKKTLRVNQNFKLKNVKSTKLKKRLLKRLVYKIQAAKRDRKLAARLYDLKRQFKAKTALKKDSKCSKQTLQQIPETPIDQWVMSNVDSELHEELCECIDKLIDIKIMKVLPLQRIHVEFQQPLIQFVTYTAEPLRGRRLECDLTKLPTRWELLWIMLQSDRIIYNDLFYIRQQLRRDPEVSSICRPTHMAQSTNRQNPCRLLGMFLMCLSFFALMFAIFGQSFYGPTKTFTFWEWFLSKLDYFLRLYFYIDINSY
ncbi:uncharacterized protein [Drosophila virilis]|uniref:Uncharacterized protein n=1 Tax=Drosophila virilis TaxID=7244 RepID=A0A0Q9W8M0_DROVI|nr:uncharacterized protein LOC26531762 isoform X1 [Drosophila virilis]KRF81084.1 uncharacterized protein Dvir_GJ26992 [Drosophila virilis]